MKKDFIRKILGTAAMTALVGVMTSAMVISFAGCAGGKNTGGEAAITVITREKGSGTRDAFIELTEILKKDSAGNKTDETYSEAITIESTQGIISNVSSDKNAVGYISLGSLNSTVKAVKVENTEATAVNVKSGTYKLARPFKIAAKATTLSAAGQDFINYIMSSEGQKIIEDKGYIAVEENASAYVKDENATGKVRISGSSSVSPAMEKLKEEYKKVNPDVTIEIQTTDSSAGISDLIKDNCEIAMASRDLKESEIGEGSNALVETKIAMDGIAVIINKDNECINLTIEQIKEIFTGEVTKWENVK